MNEKALALAVEFIKPWEGLCLRAYPDPASPLSKALSARNLLAKYKRGEASIPDDLRALSGKPWSLGYGETQGISEGMTWTLEQAQSRLNARVKGFMQAVLKASPKLSTQAPEALAAATSLCYNIGLGDEHHNPPIPGYTTSTVRKKIAVEDWQAAADAILLWNRAGGQVVDGLKNRRKAEREMFLKAFATKAGPTKDVPVVDKPVVIEENKKGGSIMNKIMALLNLFRKGKSVADPALWKKGQVSATAVAVAIMAAVQVAKAFGLDIGVDDGLATTIAAVLVGIGNIVVTFISSKKVGATAEGAGQEQAGAEVQPDSEPEPDAPEVQRVDSPAVADVIADVGAWLAKAHADVGQQRAEDASYYGT